MNNQSTQPGAQLPDYITSAKPNPATNRAAWYKGTAPTYAGIFLWFVFWQDAVNASSVGGALAHGLGIALLGIVLAALICHFLFYLVPGLLGQRTGLPLYIVGTSTFGATGGFLMPGFLMGVLQFGWLGVNIYFSSLALSAMIPIPAKIIMVIWGLLAAFVGLKGIQYVAKVATYLPLIPLGVLLLLFFMTVGGIGKFDPQTMENIHMEVAAGPTMMGSAAPAMSTFQVLAFILTVIVGFFATAGAAGVDFGMGNRDSKDVKMGGLIGIALATVVTAGLSAMIIAGIYGNPELSEKAKNAATAAVTQAVDNQAKAAGTTLTEVQQEAISVREAPNALYRPTSLIKVVLGETASGWLLFLLALAAFPPACFSSFIAANSFKTTLPKVNPFISVGIGAAVSIILAISGWAGDAVRVFQIIGASFGPICGAMMVDFLLNGKKWSGPRNGFNPAGWIAWLLGFGVGIAPKFGLPIPAAPVAAFVVGAVVFLICSKIGLQSKVVPLPASLADAAK